MVVRDLSVSGGGDGVLVVSWSAPDIEPSDYRLAWAREDLDFLSYRLDDEAERGNVYPAGDATSVRLENLTPGAVYKVIMRARYKWTLLRGSSDWSAAVTATASPQPDEPDTESGDESDTDSESHTDTDESDTDADVESGDESDTDADESDTDADVESGDESDTDADVESGDESDTDTGAESGDESETVGVGFGLSGVLGVESEPFQGIVVSGFSSHSSQLGSFEVASVADPAMGDQVGTEGFVRVLLRASGALEWFGETGSFDDAVLLQAGGPLEAPFVLEVAGRRYGSGSAVLSNWWRRSKSVEWVWEDPCAHWADGARLAVSFTPGAYTGAVLGGSDAELGSLSLDGAVLGEAFAAGTADYSATAGAGVSQVTVNAAAADPNACSVDIAPADADPGTDGHQIAVDPEQGAVVTVTVTAGDQATTATYTITVAGDQGPLPATAADMELTGIGIGFDPGQNRYRTTVPPGMRSTTVTVRTAPGTTADTTAYQPPTTTRTTAQTAAHQPPRTTLWADVTLSLNTPTPSPTTTLRAATTPSPTPTLRPTTTPSPAPTQRAATTLRARNAAPTLRATTNSAPTAQDGNGAISVASDRDTLIVTTVATPGNERVTTYTTRLRPNPQTQLSTRSTASGPTRSATVRSTLGSTLNADLEPRLTALSVSPGALDPAFSASTLDYEIEVGHDTGQVTVEATAAAGATATVTNPDADPDTDGHQVALNPSTTDKAAQTAIVVTVTAGTRIDSYTITATRTAVPRHNQPVHVTNFDQGTGSYNWIGVGWVNEGGVYKNPSVHAQAFTTGTHPAGYTLTAIEVVFTDSDPDTFSAALWETDGASLPRPTSKLTDLTPPSRFVPGPLTFTPPSTTRLTPSTSYALVLDSQGESVLLRSTYSTSEDAGGATGWSIADSHMALSGRWRTAKEPYRIKVSARTAAASAPVEPTGMTATQRGASQIDLSWTAPAFDGGATVTGYKVEVSTDGSTWSTLVAGQTGTTYSHMNLSEGDTRHYRVSAINSIGTGAASAVATGTTRVLTAPGKPTGVTAAANGFEKIDLSWTAPQDDGGLPITGYRIEVSTDGGRWSTLVAGRTGTTYSHKNLTAGSTRHYRVTAINARGSSPVSDVATETTNVLVNNVNQASPASNDIGAQSHAQAFTTGNNAGGYVLSAIDLVSQDAQGDDFTAAVWSTGADGRPDAELFDLTSPASSAAGRISFTAPANRTLQPGTTYAVVLTRDGSGDPTITTTTSGGEDAGAAGGWSIADHHSVQAADGTWSDAAGETYLITVRGGPPGLIRQSDLNAPPSAPAAPTVAALSTTSLSVAWEAPDDEGTSTVTGYDVQYRELPDGPWTDGPQDQTGLSATIDSLRPDTAYEVRVRAANSDGMSAWSAPGSSSTDPPPSSDATLGALTLSPKDIAGFSPRRQNYHLGVAGTVDTVTVTLRTNHDGAEYTITPADASTDPGHQVRLGSRPTHVRIAVTAEDGTSTRFYRLQVNRGVTPDFGWDASEDFDGLSAAGNENPRGMWSDGTTVWVVEDSDRQSYGVVRKLFAYRLSDKSRDPGKDIDSLGVVYRVERSSGTAPGVPRAVTPLPPPSVTWEANAEPTGIWSDGTTMWVADADEAKIFAYWLTGSGGRRRHLDFNTLRAAGNTHPTGIWSDGTTMWVADGGNRRIYAYRMSDRTRDTSKEFRHFGGFVERHTTQEIVIEEELEGGLQDVVLSLPSDLWSDGTTMWVADSYTDKVYAYRMSDKTRDPAKDFDTLSAAGNTGKAAVWPQPPTGIWSDGTTMWVTNDDFSDNFNPNDKIFAYNMPPGNDARLRALTVSPTDIFGFAPSRSSYEVGVAADVTEATVAATLSHPRAALAFTSPDADPAEPDHQVGLSAGRNLVSVRVTSEVGDSEHTYTVSINRGVTAEFGWKATADLDRMVARHNTDPTDVWSDGTIMWVADNTEDKLFAYRVSDGSWMAEKDFNTLRDAGNTDPTGVWSDGTTMWVADSRDNRIYAYKKSDKSRDPAKDFNTLGAAGNTAPRSIWSDGTTMWVSDISDNRIYAYRMSDKSRDGSKEFANLSAAGNTSATGIWSDGTTMWVADWSDARLYAYKMSDKTRDSAKDYTTLGGAGNTRPYGIWSNETTMWVVDQADNKVYSYNTPAPP